MKLSQTSRPPKTLPRPAVVIALAVWMAATAAPLPTAAQAAGQTRGASGARRQAPAVRRQASVAHRQASSARGQAPPARASATAVLRQLDRQMSLAGAHSGAYVYDLTSHRQLFSMRAGEPHPPASVEKLYTSTAALELMGPRATLTTSVLGSGQLGPRGRWEGDLYLRGEGDPTFGSSAFIAARYGGTGTSVATLAQRLKADGIRSVSGHVYGDESFLDTLRGEPSSGYRPDPELEGQLSGLAFDRGETGHERGPHAPAAYAASQLRAALSAEGIRARAGGAATAPMGTTVLALAQSPPLSTLLGLMLPPSDNFFAEMLIKDLGARFGGAGSTAAGVTVVRREMARFGVHPHTVDGSGLSHSDATTPRQVVLLLAKLAHTSVGAVLRGDMAVAGHTGTLEDRMRGTVADERCQGKTGTLDGVSNLAGYCNALGGHLLAFAFFDDGIEMNRAHTIQDAMTITLARY